MKIDEAISLIDNMAIGFMNLAEHDKNQAQSRMSEALFTAGKALRFQRDYEKDNQIFLEELRYMKGMPVYIVPVRSNSKIKQQWMLLDEMLENGLEHDKSAGYPVHLFRMRDGQTIAFSGSNYGKTWLAYRRPPKMIYNKKKGNS